MNSDLHASKGDILYISELCKKYERGILANIRSVHEKFKTISDIQRDTVNLRRHVNLLKFHLENLEGWLATLDDEKMAIYRSENENSDCIRSYKL